MDEVAKNAFDKFESLLRTFIPGCIFIGILFLGDEKERLDQLTNNSGAILAFAALLSGVILYSIHYCILEDIWTGLAVWLLLKFDSNLLHGPQKSYRLAELLRWLSLERCARPGSDNPITKSHQTYLTHEYAWLIFTYCTAYAFVASAIVLWCHQPASVGYISAAFALAIFLAALKADMRISRKEIWLNYEFPQHTDSNATIQHASTIPDTPRKSESPFATAAHIATTIALVVGIISLIITWFFTSQQINQTEHWHKLELSANLIEMWNSNLKANVSNIQDKYLLNFHKNIPIESYEAYKIFNYRLLDTVTLKQDTLYKSLYKETIWILNHLETISQFYNHDVVDTQMINESSKSFMQRSFCALYPFISYYRENTQAKYAWQPFVKLIGRWNANDTLCLNPF